MWVVMFTALSLSSRTHTHTYHISPLPPGFQISRSPEMVDQPSALHTLPVSAAESPGPGCLAHIVHSQMGLASTKGKKVPETDSQSLYWAIAARDPVLAATLAPGKRCAIHSVHRGDGTAMLGLLFFFQQLLEF